MVVIVVIVSSQPNFVTDNIRDKNKLHSWFWQPLIMMGQNLTMFRLVPLRTTNHSSLLVTVSNFKCLRILNSSLSHVR